MQKVLVANRGEIAVRVMRTCRELGLRTVAVYSEADRRAAHVRMADEAYLIGPAAAVDSYLDQQSILRAALESGSDAIHPGYGFLSENPDFSAACALAGIVFIGPSPEAMRAMGDKTTARRLMAEAGVPMAPGTPDAIADVQSAVVVARQIGFPVLIKAAAGGGGKGMRLVHEVDAVPGAMEMAQREALNAFGDGRVFIEKYLDRPRHIEFQVLADHHGQIVHVFERECSIQRRHQKVIEEAPSALLDETLRARMGEAAVAAARACGYRNAGTVEFLVDVDRNFYFMEMNTRLQVEHPVTELITGIDLVAEQIRIARGEPLRFTQSDLGRRGHAIECRVYAEDPDNDFLPDPGLIVRHRPPAGPGIRVDGGIDEGGEVLVHYDPMISKLIVWGESRALAIARMKRALEEYEIAGVRTTISFCRSVMDSEAFREGALSTHFVEEHLERTRATRLSHDRARLASIAAALFANRHEHGASRTETDGPTTATGAWLSRRRLT